MRKSFDTLAALVKEALRQDLPSGSLFLFVSRNRKRAKVLYFDGTGLCLLDVGFVAVSLPAATERSAFGRKKAEM